MADIEKKKGKLDLYRAYLESLTIVFEQRRTVLGIQLRGMLESAVARVLDEYDEELYAEGVHSAEYSLKIDISPDDEYDYEDIEHKMLVLERCIEALEEENNE